ncbi:hypothetical protein CU048_04540 [Beijerinckiaceae bacterium]|nr:hypothetical protein CU048_04540 [Beijerinckiaceae bacterium]
MASSYDLVSLADLKAWLEIAGSDDDVLLARLITQISRTILNVLDRPAIQPTAFTETHDGGNDISILLRQWPVFEISKCIVNGIEVPPSPPLAAGTNAQCGYVLDPPDAAPPGTVQRLSLRHRLFTRGVQNVMISYVAGYAIRNESVVVPVTPPYSVSVQAPYGDWASDVGVTSSSGVAFVAATTNPTAGCYTVLDGVYTFSPEDTGATMILSYGYVPADLASCCMEWAAERYAYRSRIGQQSKSLGGQETMAFIVKDIPDFVEAALTPYRRVVMP